MTTTQLDVTTTAEAGTSTGIGTTQPATPTWEDLRALESRLDQRASGRDGWTLFTFVLAVVAVLFGAVAVGFGARAIGDANRVRRSAASPAPALAASPGPITLSEFKVQPAATTVAAGKVTFQITNAGTVQHELLVFRSDLAPSAYPLKDGDIDEENPAITKLSDGDNLDPGATQTRTVDLTQPGTYLFVCNLPGHFKAGMYQVVTVK